MFVQVQACITLSDNTPSSRETTVLWLSKLAQEGTVKGQPHTLIITIPQMCIFMVHSSYHVLRECSCTSVGTIPFMVGG